ncbi:MAG: YihY/virulence factor BrkB family protein [Akkermansiaceae bacterium]
MSKPLKEQKLENTPKDHAKHPFVISRRGWWKIAKRVQKEIGNDSLQLISAGVAFYFFLSIFPVLAAIISIYGLFTSVEEAENHVEGLGQLLPTESQEVLTEITTGILSKSDQTLGWGLVIAIFVSVWSANKGTKALVKGLNVSYSVRETRSYLRKTTLTLVLTLSTFSVIMILLGVIAGLPVLMKMHPWADWVSTLLQWVRWPFLAIIICLVFAGLYRWAPNRSAPRWQWITPGSMLAMTFWLLGSAVFSYYTSNFDSLGKTYGSFTAVVTLLLWLFLTAFVILIGAKINSECEKQTKLDTAEEP